MLSCAFFNSRTSSGYMLQAWAMKSPFRMFVQHIVSVSDVIHPTVGYASVCRQNQGSGLIPSIISFTSHLQDNAFWKPLLNSGQAAHGCYPAFPAICSLSVFALSSIVSSSSSVRRSRAAAFAFLNPARAASLSAMPIP